LYDLPLFVPLWLESRLIQNENNHGRTELPVAEDLRPVQDLREVAP
jgi:hypothetical protein